MTVLTPSGDTTGVTDTSAINAALLLNDVELSNSGTWYVKADANGLAIDLPNNKTIQGQGSSSSDWTRVTLVGTSSATFIGNVIGQSTSGAVQSVRIRRLYIDGGRNGTQSTLISFTAATKTISISSGFLHNRGFGAGDSITIAGSVSNNGTYTIASITATTVVVNEALVNESAGATVRIFKSTANGVTLSGACISLASQNNYVNTGVVISDCYLKDGPTQQTSINSVIGVTISNVTTTATYYPVQLAHGCDFDAVAVDKPTNNVTISDCDLDSYGQECLKFENTKNVTIYNTRFRAYVTLTQDAIDIYSCLNNITFNNCTFDAWVSLGYLKRQHIEGQAGGVTTPAATLTLSLASAGTGRTVTASASIFSSGDIGKSFAATESSITGFATITNYINPTTVEVTIVNKFADTSIASGWQMGWMNNNCTGAVTFSGCTFSTDDSVIIGSDNSANSYSDITITNCTFRGRNWWFFPSAYTPTNSGNVGVGSYVTLWVRNTVSDKYKNVLGATSTGMAVMKSYGNTSASAAIGILASALYDSFSFANAKITFVNDTYTNAFISGFTNGNVNIPFSVEAESYLGTIIDGTGSTGSFIALTGTNNQIVTIADFLIKNFTGGASTRGIVLNHANAAAVLRRLKIQDCQCSNGGAGIRLQTATSLVIDSCHILNCSLSGGNGAGILLDAANLAVVKSTRIEGCSITAGTGSGSGIRATLTTGTFTMYGCEVVNCSIAGTGQGAIFISSGSGTPTSNITNCTLANNTVAAGSPDFLITITAAGSACNIKNCIVYSTGTPISKSGSGTLTTTYSDVRGGSAGTGNVNVDPLFADNANRDYRLQRGSTLKWYGSYDSTVRDRRGNLYHNKPSVGAWEFLEGGMFGGARFNQEQFVTSRYGAND